MFEGEAWTAAQAPAPGVIQVVVFAGSAGGLLRAYSARDGRILWSADTNGEFQTVNGKRAHGGSMICAGPSIAEGMPYVNSGYGSHAARGGNVLLAYGIDQAPILKPGSRFQGSAGSPRAVYHSYGCLADAAEHSHANASVPVEAYVDRPKYGPGLPPGPVRHQANHRLSIRPYCHRNDSRMYSLVNIQKTISIGQSQPAIVWVGGSVELPGLGVWRGWATTNFELQYKKIRCLHRSSFSIRLAMRGRYCSSIFQRPEAPP